MVELVTNTSPSSDTSAEATLERAQTDESLRGERANADAALAEKRSADDAADKLVNTARSNADAILDHAREKADNKLAAVGTAFNVLQDVVEKERVKEDSLLKHERAVADVRLREERQQQAVLLESGLQSERTQTDRYLLTERTRSDDAIASRDDFLGMVSHDLRNLLGSITLDALLSQAQASDSEEGRRTTEVMKRVHRNAKHMGRIVDDLIDVVAIDAGKLVMRPQPGDASLLLTEAAGVFGPTAATSRISLVVDSGAQPLQACFDYQRMLQVLSNLLSNAIKFTPANGRVVMGGQCDGEVLRLTVSDNGPGIPAHMLEAVFERFWQVGKNDQRGLGLGLYISRCIVEGHQGAIRVESTVGQGSTFIATIPCQAQRDGHPG